LWFSIALRPHRSLSGYIYPTQFDGESDRFSYHLSSLPSPTDAQKNLITAFNAIFAAGTTAVFGLLNDDDE
jgi:hypothetical protein